MEYAFRARGELTIQTLSALVDPIVDGSGLSEAESILLDLSDVTFVTPGSLAPLAALLELVSERLPPVNVRAPTNGDCRRYLAAAGLLQVLRGFVAVGGAEELDGIEPSSTVPTVLPLTRLGGQAEIPVLLHQLEDRLDEMLGCGDESWARTKRPILSTIRELCENVFQHAGGAPGWLAAQKYRNRRNGKPYVEIAIADAGHGVRRTLATRYTEMLTVTDGAALGRMVLEQLTRHTNAYRGTGYYVLQLATKELDGSFWLRSGSGALNRPRRGSLSSIDGLTAWPGTHLQTRLTCA